jgi:hypothetical protein
MLPPGLIQFDCAHCPTAFCLYVRQFPAEVTCPVCRTRLAPVPRPGSPLGGSYETIIQPSRDLAFEASERVRRALPAAAARLGLTVGDLIEQLMEFPLAADLDDADRTIAQEKGLPPKPQDR